MKIATTKQRILQYVEYKRISKQEFYRITGLNRGFLDADKLNQAIEDMKIASIIAAFPELSIEWLITGNGGMIINPKPVLDASKSPPPVEINQGIPLLPIHAEAGAFNIDLSVMGYDCEYFNIPTFKGADFLITVRGDSMMPNYKSGDIVACKKLALGVFIQWNRVYVIDTDQGPIIKRIRQSKTEDKLLIVSDNQDFSPFEIPVDSIHNLALVIGSIRPE